MTPPGPLTLSLQRGRTPLARGEFCSRPVVGRIPLWLEGGARRARCRAKTDTFSIIEFINLGRYDEMFDIGVNCANFVCVIKGYKNDRARNT